VTGRRLTATAVLVAALGLAGCGSSSSPVESRAAVQASPTASAAPLVVPSPFRVDETQRMDLAGYEKATRASETHPEWLAGAWFDRDGSLVVGVKVGAPPTALATISDLGIRRLTVRPVTFSLRDLRDGQARVFGGVPGVTSVGVNVAGNRISVGMDPPDLASRQKVYALVGDMAEVYQGGLQRVLIGGQSGDGTRNTA
jgi:hypothetical protein